MNRIAGLDALRGYAALVVLMTHVGDRLGIPYIHGGNLAVDVFFLISGYVISHAYDSRLLTLGLAGFCRVRLIRFYSLYLVGTLLGFLIFFAYATMGRSSPFTISQLLFDGILPNLFFIPILPDSNSLFGEKLFIDIPAWSLLFELIINIFYALFFNWLSRRVLLSVIAICGVCVALLMIRFNGIQTDTNGVMLLFGFARVGFSFPLGVLLFRERDRLPRIGALGPLVPVAMVIVFWPPNSWWRDIIAVLIASPIFVIAARDAQPVWPRLGSFLATISYCVYVIHAPILDISSAIASKFRIPEPFVFSLTIVGLLIGSWLLDRYYDRPLRKWLNSRLGPPKNAYALSTTQ